MISMIKQRWQQLQVREQRLVAAMIAIVMVFILYSGLWQPLNNNIEKATSKLSRYQSLLSWQSEKLDFYKKNNHVKRVSSGSLTSVVNRIARQHNITIMRMQPKGNELKIQINELPFDTLMNWLAELVEQQGLQVLSLDIAQADTPGVVQVKRLQLGK